MSNSFNVQCTPHTIFCVIKNCALNTILRTPELITLGGNMYVQMKPGFIREK